MSKSYIMFFGAYDIESCIIHASFMYQLGA
jgi:hypothetical protein